MKTKRSKRGQRRVFRSLEERQELVWKYESGDLSKAEFCRLESIPIQTLGNWLKTGVGSRKLREEQVGFTKVEVAVKSNNPIEVILANGVRVSIPVSGSVDELATLIRGVAGC